MITHPVRWRVLSLLEITKGRLILTETGAEILIFHCQNVHFWSDCRFLTELSCFIILFKDRGQRKICLFQIFVLFFMKNLTHCTNLFFSGLPRLLLCCLSILSSRATDSLPPSSLLSSSTTSTVSCRPSQAMLTLLSGWLIAHRIVVNSLAND